MIGLERGTVELVPYRPGWASLADEELGRLADRLGDGVVERHHVGSTAIEGMAAKPVIDLLAVVESIDEPSAYVSALEGIGYEYRENDTRVDRLFFAKGPPEDRRYYLSVTERGSPCHREQLAFRDRLRDDDALAAEYEALKRELAAAHPDDRASYTDGKSDFVESVLSDAGDGR